MKFYKLSEISILIKIINDKKYEIKIPIKDLTQFS